MVLQSNPQARRAANAVLVGLLLIAGCGSDGGGILSDPTPSAKLSVDIDELPGPTDEKSGLNYVRGTITLTGTVTVSNGELERVFIDEKNLATAVEVPAGAGTENEDGALVYTFSIAVDTAATYLKDPDAPDEEPRRVWRDGKRKIKVAAESTSGRRGNETFEAIVDNTEPVLTCTGPVAQSAHVGKVDIQCCVDEDYLGAIPVFLSVDGGPVDQANPAMVITEDDLDVVSCFSKTLDRGLAATAEIGFNIGIADRAGNQSLVSIAGVRMLRPPAFDGIKQNRTLIEGDVQPWDFDVGDVDKDGLIDAVVATNGGVRAYWGEAGDDGGHTGRFGAATEITADASQWVLLRDLDKDGAKDVILATNGSLDSYIEVWIARGREFIRLERMKLDHSTDGGATFIRHAVKVITDADFDGDGGLDFAIGGETLEEGLVVVHSKPTVECTVEVGDTVQIGPCGQVPDLSLIKSGVVFDRIERYFGTANVTGITAGNFFTDSDVPDLAITRSELSGGVLSMCRNKGGSEGFASCQNVTLPGSEPLVKVAAADYGSPASLSNTDTIDDLVTFSSVAQLRWTRVRGDGLFDNIFRETNAEDQRVDFGWVSFLGSEERMQLKVREINSGGEKWVFLPALGPTVPRFPLDPTDEEIFANCFTNFVFGVSVLDVELADIDGENEFDMIVLDLGSDGEGVAGPSIATFLSDGNGGYQTTKVYATCSGSKAGGLAAIGSATFSVADFDGDQYPDLVTFGPVDEESSPFKGPAIPMNLRTSTKTSLGLIDKTRNGYFAPHDTWNGSNGGPGGAEIKAEDASLPSPTASATGRIDLDNRADLVLTLDKSYTLGEDEPSGNSEVCPPCLAVEWHEVDNGFGVQTFEGDEEGGVPQCCTNFTAPNEGQEKSNIPIKGYGGGAPVVRTSAYVLTALPTDGSGSQNAVFGLTTSNDWVVPARLTPTYSMAAGIQPRDVKLADFNSDGLTDMVTLMGAAPETKYCQARLYPRLRLFLGDGQGKFTPYLLFPETVNENIQFPNAGFPHFNQTGGSLSAGSSNSKTLPLELIDGFKCIEDIDGTLFEYDGLYRPTYLFSGNDPVQLQVASFCGEQLPSLFSLNAADGDISVLRNGWFDIPQRPLQRGKEHAVGAAVAAMDVQDVNSDQCNDLVVAMETKHGIVPGTSAVEQYETQDLETFPLKAKPRAISVIDINNDGFLDRVTADSDARVRFYLGDGRGGFVAAPTFLPLTEPPTKVETEDMDLDGCRDLQIGGASRIAILRNEACDEIPAP